MKFQQRWTDSCVWDVTAKKCFNGNLRQGVTKMVATKFSTSIRTVQRIWNRSNKGEGTSETVCSRKPRNCGRKRVEINLNQMRDIPLRNRTTLESLACVMNVKKSTLIRHLYWGEIKRHSNAKKPHLKDENKITWLRFCLSMLDRIPHDPVFMDMFNTVHIDEKWFYMTKKIGELLFASGWSNSITHL